MGRLELRLGIEVVPALNTGHPRRIQNSWLLRQASRTANVSRRDYRHPGARRVLSVGRLPLCSAGQRDRQGNLSSVNGPHILTRSSHNCQRCVDFHHGIPGIRPNTRINGQALYSFGVVSMIYSLESPFCSREENGRGGWLSGSFALESSRVDYARRIMLPETTHIHASPGQLEMPRKQLVRIHLARDTTGRTAGPALGIRETAIQH
jgi:hypothetical protein